jgi:hypothetical protein
MVTLVIATRNAHKAGEIRAILGERFSYLTLNDWPQAPEVVEDTETFAGNAAKKAVAAILAGAQPVVRSLTIPQLAWCSFRKKRKVHCWMESSISSLAATDSYEFIDCCVQ